jgi:hypothetical protein
MRPSAQMLYLAAPQGRFGASVVRAESLLTFRHPEIVNEFRMGAVLLGGRSP